jgi:alkanesulfonate monooxygenase SsuD/methylene tetrahydromethanopterin reductase-like flavin-dependent oxidoreductase (luciferase family)
LEFGIFQSATVGPRPWDHSEPTRLREDIEMGVLADEVGFDYFWAPEHHFLEEYSHNSSSHLSCLAVGMLTERIRVATGIFNICPPVNHPVRVAEQIAMIDVLTNGRVELGTGRGSGSTEVNGFGVTNEESRLMWEEAIHAIPLMWTQDLFSWDGTYFSVPERHIIPTPVQKPHPPLWVTATNPSTVERAAQLGLGVAMFNFDDPAKLEPLVEHYKRTVVNAEPIAGVVNDKIMTLSRTLCLPDREAARRQYAATADNTAPLFRTYFDTVPANFELHQDVPRPVDQSVLREWIRDARTENEAKPSTRPVLNPGYGGHLDEDQITFDLMRTAGISVGDPDDVAATLRRFEDVGFDMVCLVPRAAFNEPFDMTKESLTLIGREVLPRFR